MQMTERKFLFPNVSRRTSRIPGTARFSGVSSFPMHKKQMKFATFSTSTRIAIIRKPCSIRPALSKRPKM